MNLSTPPRRTWRERLPLLNPTAEVSGLLMFFQSGPFHSKWDFQVPSIAALTAFAYAGPQLKYGTPRATVGPSSMAFA